MKAKHQRGIDKIFDMATNGEDKARLFASEIPGALLRWSDCRYLIEKMEKNLYFHHSALRAFYWELIRKIPAHHLNLKYLIKKIEESPHEEIQDMCQSLALKTRPLDRRQYKYLKKKMKKTDSQKIFKICQYLLPVFNHWETSEKDEKEAVRFVKEYFYPPR